MEDFVNSLEYGIPDEIESDVRGLFFKPEPGVYKAIWADIIPIFKDRMTDKYSEEPTGTSELSFLRQRFVLINYIGAGSVTPINYLTDINGTFVITDEKNASSIIYGDFIPIAKSEQWRIHSRYSDLFRPPLWEKRENNKRVTLLKNFPAHYGRIVYLLFDVSKNGKVYLKSVTPHETGAVYDRAKLDELLKEIKELSLKSKSSNEEQINPEELVDDVPF